MAQARTFNIQLSPATKTDGGYSVVLMDPNAKKYTATVAGMPALDAEVRRLVAEEFKQSASAYVTFARSEKAPPGFKAATSKLRFIEYAPQA